MFQGLSMEVEKYLPVATSSAHLVYLNRAQAEQDRRFKQLIPYVLVFCNDRLLRYRRGRGGEEKRLHGLYSIGVGGHISEEDHGLFSKDVGYREGMQREVREEVAIDQVSEATVAVINDDSTEVGYVHFGVVHIVRVINESIAGRRSGIVSPEFILATEAQRDASNYESWSRLCLENLDDLLARAGLSGVVAPERV